MDENLSPLEKLNQIRQRKAEEEKKNKQELEIKEIAENEGLKAEKIVDEKALREAELEEILLLESEQDILKVELEQRGIRQAKTQVEELKEKREEVKKEGKEAIKNATTEEVDLLRKDKAVREEVFGKQIKQLKEINENVKGKKIKIKDAESLQKEINSLKNKIRKLENRPVEKIQNELQAEIDLLENERKNLKQKRESLQKERDNLGFEENEKFKGISSYRDFPDNEFLSGIDQLKEKNATEEEINIFIKQKTSNPLLKRFGEIYAKNKEKLSAEDFKKELVYAPASHMNAYHKDVEIEKIEKKHNKEIPEELQEIDENLKENIKKLIILEKQSKASRENDTDYYKLQEDIHTSQNEIKDAIKKINFYKNEAPKYMKDEEDKYLKKMEEIENEYDKNFQINIGLIKEIFSGKEPTPGLNYRGVRIPKNMPLGFFENVPDEVRDYEMLINFLKKKEGEAQQLKIQAEKNAKDVSIFTKKSEKEERNERVQNLSEFCKELSELTQEYEGFKELNQKQRDEKIAEERKYLGYAENKYSAKVSIAEREKIEKEIEKNKSILYRNDEIFSHMIALRGLKFKDFYEESFKREIKK